MKHSNGTDKQQKKDLDATNIDTEMLRHKKRVEVGTKKWNRRLKLITCCMGYKRNKDTYLEVANSFGEYFADFEVSFMEAITAMLLLKDRQEAQKKWLLQNEPEKYYAFLSNQPVTPETKFLDFSSEQESLLLEELSYYLEYAIAVFGWPLAVFERPFLACCLCPYLSLPCFKTKKVRTMLPDYSDIDASDNLQVSSSTTRASNNVRSDSKPIIIEDNCCLCNLGTYKKLFRNHNSQLIYVSYHVDVNVVPFLVAVDHGKQAIILSIRGSMSSYDTITDFNATEFKIPMPDCPDDWLCHKGMGLASKNIITTLESNFLLEEAFNSRPDLGSRNYRIVVCGHSLGAGVASIVGIILYSKYPKLRAFLYSPPGGMMTKPAVEYSKKFAISVYLGNDVVPRVGIAQGEKLRYCAIDCLNTTKTSKTTTILSAICPSSCCKNEFVYDPNTCLDYLFCQEADPISFRGAKVPFQCQSNVLFVPGKLIHVVESGETSKGSGWLCWRKKPVYKAVWDDNYRNDRILLADHMIRDHLPHALKTSLRSLFLHVQKNSQDPQ